MSKALILVNIPNDYFQAAIWNMELVVMGQAADSAKQMLAHFRKK